ncbi:hypothetical protein PV04_03573 [Phialophora macrospora]|uniref:Uncharacterized protein n=1 Tax=Phialophora macrospora TaxID=1851006 RepID=A0A0D2FSJ5_9EURO|nr:hypothetical protein PV04_03573 [Phialophora macrospora]
MMPWFHGGWLPWDQSQRSRCRPPAEKFQILPWILDSGVVFDINEATCPVSPSAGQSWDGKYAKLTGPCAQPGKRSNGDRVNLKVSKGTGVKDVGMESTFHTIRKNWSLRIFNVVQDMGSAVATARKIATHCITALRDCGLELDKDMEPEKPLDALPKPVKLKPLDKFSFGADSEYEPAKAPAPIVMNTGSERIIASRAMGFSYLPTFCDPSTVLPCLLSVIAETARW